MGNWINDRDQRKANEAKWGSVGVDPRKTGVAKSDKRVDDLDRAIKADVAKGSLRTEADGRVYGSQGHGDPGPGGWPKPSVGGTTGGTLGEAWKSQSAATRVERPMVPGGCCHDASVAALVLSGGRKLYGAQGAKIVNGGHLDLILDCAGHVQTPKAFVKASGTGAGKYRKLNGLVWPDVVRLDWPDMTAPTKVGIKFWQELHRLLPQHTAVACMGGHGRTGTALAALLVADGMGGQAAIDRVRKEHCPRAIETKEQEEYIRGLAKARERQSR